METRSEVVVRRTYSRPKDKDETAFESWEEICQRVRSHQQWLWERALKRPLNEIEHFELDEFCGMMVSKKLSTSGRTLWLGGTEIAKFREASQFNCAGTEVETVYDVVDVLWLLMQGCGVGFKPVIGTLNGFFKPIKDIDVIRTKRTTKGGRETNKETFKDGTWTISIGDSAESWAKSIGKLLAGKHNASKLVFDFSELRPAGSRLSGYGWISSGDEAIATSYLAIAEIMNKRAGQLLNRIDILDIVNWLGTILSSRRSAQIALFEYGQPEWKEFAIAKREFWVCKKCGSHMTSKGYCEDCGAGRFIENGRLLDPDFNNRHRTQSNNSLVFESKPERIKLVELFKLMEDAGGSEPGFINGETAKRRAPWFKSSNPCCEILLPNKGFCNLVEVDVAKFRGDSTGLHRALELAARANYRQTCVNLKDGILQEAWHLNNEFLRLCGVGLTGIVQRDDLSEYDLQQMKNVAIHSAYGMADELGMQRPKNVTTIKPSGTLSKVMSTTEGVHKPLAKYIMNWINFGKNDPLLPILKEAGYMVIDNPNQPTEGTIVKFPIKWDHVEFDKVVKPNGDIVEVNLESAIHQLERYKKYQVHWCQQNVSNTISYSPDEVPAIIDWLLVNWEHYVGVSFLYRMDASKTAADLGYLYLPQEVCTKEAYEEYVKGIKTVDFSGMKDSKSNEMESLECSGGSCPVI